MESQPTLLNANEPKLAVVVAAFDGFVEVYERLLKALPCDTGMAFFCAHGPGDGDATRLRDALAQCTTMTVVTAEESVDLCPNTVYLVSSSSDIRIDDVTMTVEQAPADPGPGKPGPVDRIFAEVSERFGSRTVGVLLSTHEDDGAQGLREIQRLGGLTVAEAPGDKACNGVTALIDEGVVDLVLQVDYLPRALNRFSEHLAYSQGHMLLAAIVSNSDDAIVSKTLDGTILSWNRSAERIFGYTAAEAVGQSIELIIPPELHDEETTILARLGRGERIDHFETVRVAKDGRRLDISLTVSPIREKSGRIVGASKVARDVTGRKRAEAALREADRRKDEYLAMLGHELRNPLAAIQSAGEVILQSCTDDALVQRGAAIVDRQASHMAKLLDGLLDVSRITRGKLEIEKTEVDLIKVLGDVITGGAHKPQREHIEIRTDFGDLPVRVRGDATRLTQVFANLVDNALKFTDPGGTIFVTTDVRGDRVEVTVRDTGVGFVPDRAVGLFEPFRQGPQDFSRSQGGLGLGLALARGLVELHDGTIEARSDGIGCGAEFVVCLPRVQATVTLAPEHLASDYGALQIVIIEDNVDLAQMLHDRLEMQGHKVTMATTGEEGIAAARKQKPDVVICDLGLPGEASGFDVARALRRDEETREVGLVALSGYSRPEDKAKGVEVGFDVHVTKPVDFSTLDEVLAEFSKPETPGSAGVKTAHK